MKNRVNLVKAAITEGRTAYGLAVQMNSPETVELAGAVGYDFVYIDCEHGSFYLEGAITLIRAAEASGITPFVRVPNHEPSFIMRVLDAGAMGVIVPQVSMASEARVIVSAARYLQGDNGGIRGACPGTRATWHQTTSWQDFTAWSNANVSVVALLETEAALANYEAIATVPGLDATMFGPFDYAHAAGYPGEPRHEAVQAKYRQVMATAQRMGHPVVASLFSHEPADMTAETADFVRAGAQILVAGADRRILFHGMRSRLAAMRAAEKA